MTDHTGPQGQRELAKRLTDVAAYLAEGLVGPCAEWAETTSDMARPLLVAANLISRAPTQEEGEESVRYEDGIPHHSHRWVEGCEDQRGLCGDCGVDIEDEEAPDPCPTSDTDRAPSEGQDRTHWEGCYTAHGHHGCALAEIQRLRAALSEQEPVAWAAVDQHGRYGLRTEGSRIMAWPHTDAGRKYAEMYGPPAVLYARTQSPEEAD